MIDRIPKKITWRNGVMEYWNNGKNKKNQYYSTSELQKKYWYLFPVLLLRRLFTSKWSFRQIRQRRIKVVVRQAHHPERPVVKANFHNRQSKGNPGGHWMPDHADCKKFSLYSQLQVRHDCVACLIAGLIIMKS